MDECTFFYRAPKKNPRIKEVKFCNICKNSKNHFHTLKIRFRKKRKVVKRYYMGNFSYKMNDQPAILNANWITVLKGL